MAWFFGSFYYQGLGITLGYHRLLTHKSLRLPRWLMYVIVAGGYFCLMGSPIVWVGVHRLHHQKSDQPGDPHSPNDGFWHAMFGWMTKMRGVQTDEELQRAAGELMADPFFRVLGTEHKAYQAALCLGVNIIARVALFFAFGWVALLANVAATLTVFIGTQMVNAVCHLQSAGYRLYDTREDSRNVWYVAMLTLGEGWHNNHHAMPKSARHGMAWWEFDLTWVSIWLLEKVGLARNIIRPTEHRQQRFHRVPLHAMPAASMASLAPSMAAMMENVVDNVTATMDNVVDNVTATMDNVTASIPPVVQQVQHAVGAQQVVQSGASKG